MSTATTARIRFVSRESEYAIASDAAVLVNRPDAIDGYQRVRESFFDNVANAQTVLNEVFAFLKTFRRHEAVEVDGLLSIGTSIPIRPTIPKARIIDEGRGLDVTIYIRGLAVDHNSDRNSVECDG